MTRSLIKEQVLEALPAGIARDFAEVEKLVRAARGGFEPRGIRAAIWSLLSEGALARDEQGRLKRN